jgi:hypothetical protein
MHKPDAKKTRITIERISVTTIRRRDAVEKVYCDICRELIEAPRAEPLLLNGEVADMGEITEIEPDTDTNTDRRGEQTK